MAAKSAKITTEVIESIAKAAQLSPQQVVSVFEALSDVAKAGPDNKGPSILVLPGFLKITPIQKRAAKAHKGANVFEMFDEMYGHKPARKVKKVSPLNAPQDTAE
jgi:hypothetical protein